MANEENKDESLKAELYRLIDEGMNDFHEGRVQDAKSAIEVIRAKHGFYQTQDYARLI